VGVLGQLGETAFDRRQPGARAVWFERELDVGAPRIVLGQSVDRPGEAEHGRLLDPFRANLDRVPAAPRQWRLK
jgi:hypothetical protein